MSNNNAVERVEVTRPSRRRSYAIFKLNMLTVANYENYTLVGVGEKIMQVDAIATNWL
jgi:hypothetical protein